MNTDEGKEHLTGLALPLILSLSLFSFTHCMGEGHTRHTHTHRHRDGREWEREGESRAMSCSSLSQSATKDQLRHAGPVTSQVFPPGALPHPYMGSVMLGSRHEEEEVMRALRKVWALCRCMLKATLLLETRGITGAGV